jgi:hypothetical protein
LIKKTTLKVISRKVPASSDAARRVYGALRYTNQYIAFSIEVIYEDSLHAHNAAARLNLKKQDCNDHNAACL